MQAMFESLYLCSQKLVTHDIVTLTDFEFGTDQIADMLSKTCTSLDHPASFCYWQAKQEWWIQFEGPQHVFISVHIRELHASHPGHRFPFFCSFCSWHSLSATLDHLHIQKISNLCQVRSNRS